MPKVSVIIPNYNHGHFLAKRIESVLNQTYQDFDVLLMDDCSTDNSREIIEIYCRQDKRIKKLYNETNSGSAFKQWNIGISHVEGEYIWIAESDDYADKRFLECLVPKLDFYPTAGIAYSHSWIINENDSILHSGLKWFDTSKIDHWQNDFFNTGFDECKNFLILHNTIFNASAVLFRKAVYQKAGPAPENFKYVGDWMQWVKMLLISDIVFIAEHLNYFRKHESTTRHTSYLEFKELIEYYQVLKFIARHISIAPNVFKNAILNSRWQLAYRSPLSIKALYNLWIVYKYARNIDPLILRRMLRYFKARMLTLL